MWYKKYYLFELLICVSFFLCQQHVLAQQFLLYPRNYQTPTLQACYNDNGSYGFEDSDIVINKPWIVYCVRSMDSTFVNSDFKTKYGTINFMDRFFLYSKSYDGRSFQLLCDTPIMNGLTISHTTENLHTEYSKLTRGWAHRDDLLLWNKCLYNEITHSSVKALTIHKSKVNESVLAKKALVTGYGSSDRNDSIAQFRPFTLVYVYKMSPKSKRCLVGEVNSLNYKKMTKYKPRFAWIDSNDLFMGQTNIYLDINDDSLAQKRMEDADFYPSYFNSPDEALLWRNGGSSKAREIYRHDDMLQRGYQMRPLLLDTDDSDIIKIIGIDKYIDTFDYKKYDDALWMLKRQIRVAIAIDYETFINNDTIIQKIATSIKNGIIDKTLKDSVKYKCIIYFSSNNYREIVASDSFGDSDYIINWSLKIKKNLIDLISDNTSASNRVFEAIDLSVDAFKNVYNTNLLILIGKKPDTALSLVNYDKISKNISNKNINIAGLQLCALRGPIYDEYILGLYSIIEKAGEYKLDSIHSRFPNRSVPNSKYAVFFKVDSQYYSLNFGAFTGYIKFPSPKPNEITCMQVDPNLELTSTINKLMDENEKEHYSERSNKYVPGLNDTIMKVKKMSWELLMTNLDTSKSKYMNSLDAGLRGFITPAFTSMKHKRFDFPIFKRYMLVSENEYDSLLTNFKNISNTLCLQNNSDEKIDAVKQAMRQIAIASMGDLEVIPTYAKSISMKDLQILLTGNNTYNRIYKIIVTDLANRSEYLKSRLLFLFEFYKNTYQKLSTLKYNPRYKREGVNSENYYWIPEDFLIPNSY